MRKYCNVSCNADLSDRDLQQRCAGLLLLSPICFTDSPENDTASDRESLSCASDLGTTAMGRSG